MRGDIIFFKTCKISIFQHAWRYYFLYQTTIKITIIGNVNLILKWIYSLGNVNYIVVPSGNHVFCLSDVIKAFPQAKIIAPKHVQAIVRKLALRVIFFTILFMISI